MATTKGQIAPLIDQLWLGKAARLDYSRRLMRSAFTAKELEDQYHFFARALQRQHQTLEAVSEDYLRTEDFQRAWEAATGATDAARLEKAARSVSEAVKRHIQLHHQYTVPVEVVKNAVIDAYNRVSGR